MITTLTELPHTMFSQAALQDGEIQAAGMLYFLEGQYLFRYRDGAGLKSKFVTAEDVAAAFTHKDQDTGWIPAGMVRQGQKPAGPFFVYSTPAQKIEVQLSADEGLTTIPIPRTVLLGIGSAYYLFALRSKYFAPDELVYKAPFPNVHAGGRICWGQFTPAEAQSRSARPVWELFFKTLFNADLAVGKSAAQHNDVRKQLRSLAEAKARQYPQDDLVLEDGKTTISRMVERILGS